MNDRVARVGRLLLVVGAGLVAGPAAAQSDLLDRAKTGQAIADQKAENSIRDVLADADKKARVSPTEAVQRLQRALRSLDLSAEISSAKRQQLAKLLQNRIAGLEVKPASAAADPKAAVRANDQKVREAAFKLEAAEIRDALSEVEKWHTANNPAAARAVVAGVNRKYPGNPVVVALTGQGNLGDAVAEAKQIQADMNRAFVASMNQVQESAIPATGDITFAKNWAEIVKRRDDDGIKLGPDELAILEALETKVGNGVKDAPFLETVQGLSNLIGKEIYLDRKSLDDTGVDLQRPVTMPGNVTARTALRAILQSQGLTFVVKDRLLQVVTLEKAQTLQVTRAYYLGELLTGAGPYPGGAVAWGPLLDYQQTMGNAKMIVDSIISSIDPLVWEKNRGPATITFHQPTMSLIVRAPAEVHASFRGKLSGK